MTIPHKRFTRAIGDRHRSFVCVNKVTRSTPELASKAKLLRFFRRRQIFNLLSFFNPKEFEKWKVDFDIGEMSVRPYPPSKISSNRRIFKILFLLEGMTTTFKILFFLLARYGIRYLSFVLFVCPCIRMDRQTKSVVCVKCHSNSRF